MKPKHYEYVIAGAGLSGLTAAAYLARAGYSVLVLEKTSALGGLLTLSPVMDTSLMQGHGQSRTQALSGPC